MSMFLTGKGLKHLRRKVVSKLSSHNFNEPSSSTEASTSGSNPNQPPTYGTVNRTNTLPPLYADVPVFANPASPDKLPWLPYELLHGNFINFIVNLACTNINSLIN